MASNLEPTVTSGGVAVAVMNLLRRQRDLYRRLHRLAERQRGLVTESDTGSLLSLLGDRQKVIRSLVQVGQELAPHREAWPETRQELAPTDREEAERILAEVSTILGQVIAADEEDARLLSARKAQSVEALQTVRSDRKAVAAYAAMAAPRLSRLDRLSEDS